MNPLSESLVQGLTYGSAYSIAALGFALIYFTTQIFHIAYGAVLTFGTYMVTDVVGQHESVLILLAGLVLGTAVAALLSVGVYRLFYATMTARGASRLELFVVSLGINLSILAVVLIYFGPEQRGFNAPTALRLHDVGPLRISYLGFATIGLAFILFLAIRSLTRGTTFGHQMQAVSANPELAVLRGVRIHVVTGAVFALGAVLSVVAGVVLGATTSVTVSAGENLTLLASIATLLGGIGSYFGAYIGGLVVGLVGATASALLPGQWSSAVVFAAFIVIVLARPQGLIRSAQTA